jgi:predicted enzyme related to lactoylglutathione lyase
MSNPFVHIELHSNDPKAARKFYGGLCDWDYQEMEKGGSAYTNISPGEGTGGGMMKNEIPGTVDFPPLYLFEA